MIRPCCRKLWVFSRTISIFRWAETDIFKAIFGIREDLNLNVANRCEPACPRKALSKRLIRTGQTVSAPQSSILASSLAHIRALCSHKSTQLNALLLVSLSSGASVSWPRLAARTIKVFGLSASVSVSWKVESHQSLWLWSEAGIVNVSAACQATVPACQKLTGFER